VKGLDTTELLDKLRKLAIISFFADDDFLDILVLKGGNALNIAYGVNDRASMDLDFSMSQDLGIKVEEAKEKIKTSLERTFLEEGFITFDVNLYSTPGRIRPEYESFWGGYTVEFKVITKEQYEQLGGDLDSVRKNAVVFDNNQGKKMKIDISKYEFVEPKQGIELDGYTVYVYTPLMVVYEKLRALCQQVEGYSAIVATNRKTRPRDFFDIYSTLKKFPDLSLIDDDNLKILIEMFKIKKVPLYFLDRLKNDRDHHSQGFESVKNTISADYKLDSFDYYFDFVLSHVEEIIQRLSYLGLYESEREEVKEE
jgi:predicted nucleotidyltransferase component of viral defense system